MSIEELLSVATTFRSAIESANLSEDSIGKEASLRMRGFPDSTCAEVTRILGIFLTTEYNIKTLVHKGGHIEKGERWWGSHEWLQYDDIIIDITADQFPMVKDKVIVTIKSKFHQKFANKIFDYECPFDLIHDPDWMIPLYEEVVKNFRLLNLLKTNEH